MAKFKVGQPPRPKNAQGEEGDPIETGYQVNGEIHLAGEIVEVDEGQVTDYHRKHKVLTPVPEEKPAAPAPKSTRGE